MAYNDKQIITDKDRKPVPQYFNKTSNQYEVIEGRDGANAFIEKGRVVKDIFTGSATVTKTYGSKMFGFFIMNEGVSNLTVTIGSITFTVKAGYEFDDLFDGFTSVTITGTSAFTAGVRE